MPTISSTANSSLMSDSAVELYEDSVVVHIHDTNSGQIPEPHQSQSTEAPPISFRSAWCGRASYNNVTCAKASSSIEQSGDVVRNGAKRNQSGLSTCISKLSMPSYGISKSPAERRGTPTDGVRGMAAASQPAVMMRTTPQTGITRGLVFSASPYTWQPHSRPLPEPHSPQKQSSTPQRQTLISTTGGSSTSAGILSPLPNRTPQPQVITPTRPYPSPQRLLHFTPPKEADPDLYRYDSFQDCESGTDSRSSSFCVSEPGSARTHTDSPRDGLVLAELSRHENKEKEREQHREVGKTRMCGRQNAWNNGGGDVGGGGVDGGVDGGGGDDAAADDDDRR